MGSGLREPHPRTKGDLGALGISVAPLHKKGAEFVRRRGCTYGIFGSLVVTQQPPPLDHDVSSLVPLGKFSLMIQVVLKLIMECRGVHAGLPPPRHGCRARDLAAKRVRNGRCNRIASNANRHRSRLIVAGLTRCGCTKSHGPLSRRGARRRPGRVPLQPARPGTLRTRPPGSGRTRRAVAAAGALGSRSCRARAARRAGGDLAGAVSWPVRRPRGHRPAAAATRGYRPASRRCAR